MMEMLGTIIAFVTERWVDLVSTLLGLGCVYLAGRGKVSNFWVGYVYCVFLFLLFMSKSLYASMAIQTVAIVINAVGHYRWTHPSAKEAQEDGTLAVTGLDKKEYAIYGALIVAITAGLYFMLVHTDDAQPLLDATCTALILTAQWLSAQKKTECWYVWIVVNITNFVLCVNAGLIFNPIKYALLLANGVWSLITWKKNERDS